MDLCQSNPYPMQYEATWTSDDDDVGIVYDGSVIWRKAGEWYFQGYGRRGYGKTGRVGEGNYISVSSKQSSRIPTANVTGWAQRICGFTDLNDNQKRTSGIRSHYEGGLRRKSKMRKSRKSNKFQKRKSGKTNRRR